MAKTKPLAKPEMSGEEMRSLVRRGCAANHLLGRALERGDLKAATRLSDRLESMAREVVDATPLQNRWSAGHKGPSILLPRDQAKVWARIEFFGAVHKLYTDRVRAIMRRRSARRGLLDPVSDSEIRLSLKIFFPEAKEPARMQPGPPQNSPQPPRPPQAASATSSGGVKPVPGSAARAVTLDEAKDVTVPFGQYSGMPLGDLLHEDPDYLVWLATVADLRSERLKSAVETIYKANEHQLDPDRDVPF